MTCYSCGDLTNPLVLIDYLLLNCPITLGLRHKLFSLGRMDWVLSRSICDMMAISFKGLGSSVRGKTLWQIVCLTLPWIMWQERNVRIFEGKVEGGRDIV